MSCARMLVNAGGPWVEDVVRNSGPAQYHRRRSVGARQSHRDRKLYDHDKCYFFQGEDGRIIFTIPYETDFTLIGTTDAEHRRCRQSRMHAEEQDYLVTFASQYLKKADTPR